MKHYNPIRHKGNLPGSNKGHIGLERPNKAPNLGWGIFGDVLL